MEETERENGGDDITVCGRGLVFVQVTKRDGADVFRWEAQIEWTWTWIEAGGAGLMDGMVIMSAISTVNFTLIRGGVPGWPILPPGT